MLDVQARLLGYPRVGPRRELKWLLERAWRGEVDAADLTRQLELRKREHLAEQAALVGAALDDFWIYDQVLETALLFGLVPNEWLVADASGRARLEEDPFGCLTDLARGAPGRPAWEMTKWFDTNYHYVVPEASGAEPRLRLLPWRVPHAEAWNVLGPFSFMKLSRLDGFDAAGLIEAYQVAAAEHDVQLVVDEPCAGLELDGADLALLAACYGRLRPDPSLIITSAFATPGDRVLEFFAERGVAVQVDVRDVPRVSRLGAWSAMPRHVIGVVDGRSPWPDPWDPVAEARAAVGARPVLLVPSTSLMFLPYTVDGEPEAAAAGLQFAREKARTLARWATRFAGAERSPAERLPLPVADDWPEPDAVAPRAPRDERRRRQEGHRLLPTTTIGSFPQTAEVRRLRRQLADGELTEDAYRAAIEGAITECVRWQAAAGLDVLVHGEFERSDMVEYFAERLDGFITTRNGWVVSYGTRCTRPPILVAPPRAVGPITVREWQVAQSATTRPVKGMLTGPVTIVNWSYRPPSVPDERLFWAVARAIEAEVRQLIAAGARVIQVDEPAVRERWPLQTPGWETRREQYREGARRALQLVFHQAAEVQMHTHMCYSEFGDIVEIWRDVDVDVGAIEFTRSDDPSYLEAFAGLGWEIGPGVFDVHSPHRPGAEHVARTLRRALDLIPAERLWVNPDCGLKTRAWSEVEGQIADLLAGAEEVRSDALVRA